MKRDPMMRHMDSRFLEEIVQEGTINMHASGGGATNELHLHIHINVQTPDEASRFQRFFSNLFGGSKHKMKTLESNTPVHLVED